VCRRLYGTQFQIPETAFLLDSITQSRVFSRCGVVFYGPFFTSDHGKAYGVIFTCTSSRAVFLECIRDQSTPSFLNSLRRLEAKFGPVETMYSDNAKTFRKAAELLRERILWKFIPERSPHFGGFYERLVQSIKTCLRKAIGRSVLSFDNLNTILQEVEGVLNRRPLSYVYDDLNSPLPIRPIDFISPDVPVGLPETPCSEDLRKVFKKNRTVLHSFWNRFKTEYLKQLRLWRRSQSAKPPLIPAPGHVVIVQAESVKNKFLFPLGIITSVVKGADGFIRSAYVKTNAGTIRRSIHLLHPLEVSGDEE